MQPTTRVSRETNGAVILCLSGFSVAEHGAGGLLERHQAQQQRLALPNNGLAIASDARERAAPSDLAVSRTSREIRRC